MARVRKSALVLHHHKGYRKDMGYDFGIQSRKNSEEMTF